MFLLLLFLLLTREENIKGAEAKGTSSDILTIEGLKEVTREVWKIFKKDKKKDEPQKEKIESKETEKASKKEIEKNATPLEKDGVFVFPEENNTPEEKKDGILDKLLDKAIEKTEEYLEIEDEYPEGIPEEWKQEAVEYAEGVNPEEYESEEYEPISQEELDNMPDYSEEKPKSFEEVTGEIPEEKVDVLFEQGFEMEEEDGCKNEQGDVLVSIDPMLTAPKLDIIGEGEYRKNILSFFVYSNYFEFIEKGEIKVYLDRQGRKEVAVLPVEKLKLKERYSLIIPQEYQKYQKFFYKLRVMNKEGKFDETDMKPLEIKKMEVGDMITGDGKKLSDEIFGQSSLKVHNIPANFARLRFAGNGFAPDSRIFLDDNEMSVDDNGKFIYESYYFPGEYTFEFKVYYDEEKDNKENTEVERDPDYRGEYLYSKSVDITVEKNYTFFVGIADMKFGKNMTEKNSELLMKNSEYDEGTFNEGRLAFYTRNRFGKYNITAQADTEGQEILHIFDGLGRREHRELFKDMKKEDKGYTFGDDSTSMMDIETQGQFYLRLEWDQNKAMWGNYSTEIDNGEYLSYSKSLYGALFKGASQETTEYGENRYSGTLFFSNPEVLSEYNIFLATGGSLYFLNKKDIVEGSEDVKIEVIDTKTGNKVKEESLSEGTDYQINNIQGRIILNEPLSQYTVRELGDVIKDNPITDYKTYLVVSYEYYEANAVYSSDYTTGGSGKYWINDNLQLGAVYVESEELDERYELAGINGVLRKTQNTYVEFEYAESKGRKTGKGLYSSTGGMSFKDINYKDDDEEDENDSNSGRAYGIKGVLSLNELYEKFTEGSMAEFWYRKKEGGFSVDSLDDGSDDIEYGFKSDYIVNDRLTLSGEYSVTESKDNDDEGDTDRDQEISLQANYAATEKLSIAVEVRNSDGDGSGSSRTSYTDNSIGSDDDDDDDDDEGTSFDVGVTATYQFTEKTTGYVGVQKAISTTKDNANDMMTTVGGSTRIGEKIGLSGEYSRGNEESGGMAQISYTTSNNHEVYMNLGRESEKGSGTDNDITFGQKMLLGEKYEVYHENQISKGADSDKEITQVYGVNVNLTEKVKVGIGYEQGDTKEEDGKTRRQGVTTTFYYDDRKRTKYNNRLEVIKEKSSGEDGEETIEYLTVNDVLYKVNDEWTAVGKLDFSITENKTTGGYDQKFMELGIGGAYRPIWNDRLNMLWKYSFIYDLNGHDEDDDYSFGDLDERSNIFSVDAVYSVNKKLDIGGKVAYKKAEMKAANDEDEWFSAETTLYAVNASYNFYKNWRVSGEYHWLISDENSEVKSGALAGIDYDVHENLRVGVGYNFTDFSDDLRYDDYRAKGVYISITGRF